jgi:GNAT superfamily N-acetyltransferase
MVTTVVDPLLTPELRDRLLAIWVETTNAGGALGLLEPADPVSAAPVAEPTWERFAAGQDALVVLYDDDGLPIGWVALAANASPLEQHWRTVRRLQVLPSYQGKGYGGTLLLAAEDHARELGLEALHLTVRGKTGTERFYEKLGYSVVGVLPNALRLSEDDVRDQLYLVKAL